MPLQFIINGLITGLLYSLLAIGFALVYNTTHIFRIAAGINEFDADGERNFWMTAHGALEYGMMNQILTK